MGVGIWVDCGRPLFFDPGKGERGDLFVLGTGGAENGFDVFLHIAHYVQQSCVGGVQDGVPVVDGVNEGGICLDYVGIGGF